MSYLAGKDRKLGEHLVETRDCITQLSVNESNLDFIKTIAFLHDFGKLTTYYQEYIEDSINPTKTVTLTPKQKRRKQHSLISAYASMYALKQQGATEPEQVRGFLSVIKHHSEPGDIKSDIKSYEEISGNPRAERRWKIVNNQIENINNSGAAETADKFLKEASNGQANWKGFKQFVRQKQALTSLYNATNKVEYASLLDWWSLLTTSDKLATTGQSPHPNGSLSPSKVNDYINNLQSIDDENDYLNKQRDKARKTALNQLRKLTEAEGNVATLTLPTGFGKTLTGIQTGLKRANEKGGRLIYALPFTSIIDQTDEVIRDVFNVSKSSPEYTVHHYLSETRTITDENDDDVDTQQLYAESWQSDIVLTTFVQLFESLAGPTNRQSLKIPALRNSVILIDEPQAITHDWWEFVSKSASILNDRYNADVILMTATQPQILNQLEHTSVPINLIPDSDRYFDYIRRNPRVKFNLDKSVEQYLTNTESACKSTSEAAKIIAGDDSQSVLAICNTIHSTTEMAKDVRSHLNGKSLNKLLDKKYDEIPSAEPFTNEIVNSIVDEVKGEVVTAVLTTRLRPIDRSILLNAITTLVGDNNTQITVISTQLVEAGVDVSFDSLYRDFAPLPSIVQAAGRCNREFGSSTPSSVTLWRLNGREGGTPPSELIYNDEYDLLRPTRSALNDVREDHSIISEQEMVQTATEKYYHYLHKRGSPGDIDLVEHVDSGRFNCLRKESVIPQSYPTVDIIITFDNESRVIRQHSELCKRGEFTRASMVLRALQNRSISVPLKNDELHNSTCSEIQPGLYHLDASDYPEQYDLSGASGLKEESVVDRFLT